MGKLPVSSGEGCWNRSGGWPSYQSSYCSSGSYWGSGGGSKEGSYPPWYSTSRGDWNQGLCSSCGGFWGVWATWGC
ncbi:hypothetical protein [Streptomyces sp. LaBMicrA B280]|uniref:hypothetical protein n=1 Tax=Streptomyces sp. LaBMicrA B280 TaxID=3391001 RepID=UPI003BA44A64